VKLRFGQSAYADYLFYLLYRNSNDFARVSTAVPLDGVPTIETLVSLPEVAASSPIRHYKDLYALLDDYRGAAGRIILTPRPKILGYGEPLPSYEVLLSILQKGESSYPKFLQFWHKEVAPRENKTIEEWQRQQLECRPLDKLQQLTRLRFPFAALDVGCIAFHFSGSGNYAPAGVYTRMASKPNLAWLIGHEATHLLVDKYIGENWTTHPLAARAITSVKMMGGEENDIEEALCLFMQVTLSQACGYTEKTVRVSERLGDEALVKKRICQALEREWSGYLSDQKKYPMIVDYLLLCTVLATDAKVQNPC
jgi:hypothetical protein